MRKIMSSLDVGNDTIKLVVGEMLKNKLYILAVSEVKTEGLSKDVITDENKLSSSISKAFEIVNEKLGMEIKKTIVIVPSKNAEYTIGEAKINVNNEENVIMGRDITNAITESYTSVIQDNMEMVNCIPVGFKLDNGEQLRNPLRKISKTLEVRSVIITAPKSSVYPILSILEKLDIDVVDIAIDSIGDYYTFKDKELDKYNGAIVNIGYNKSTISTYNKGIITNSSLIELGSNNIDKDISYVYKINLEDSKKLRMNYGILNPNNKISHDIIELIDRNNNKVNVSQTEVSKIIYSRLDEILKMIKKEINILTKKNINYIIFTGGSVETRNFKLVLEKNFGKNAIIGKIDTIGARNNKYSSAIGLIKWYNNMQRLKDRDYSIFDIEEQSKLSGANANDFGKDSSIINKVFDYFFE